VHWVRLRRKGDGNDIDVEKEENASKKKKMIFIFRVGIEKGNLFSILLTSLIIIYMRFTPALQRSHISTCPN
jgi:hypothetical protein